MPIGVLFTVCKSAYMLCGVEAETVCTCVNALFEIIKNIRLNFGIFSVEVGQTVKTVIDRLVTVTGVCHFDIPCIMPAVSIVFNV